MFQNYSLSNKIFQYLQTGRKMYYVQRVEKCIKYNQMNDLMCKFLTDTNIFNVHLFESEEKASLTIIKAESYKCIFKNTKGKFKNNLKRI